MKSGTKSCDAPVVIVETPMADNDRVLLIKTLAWKLHTSSLCGGVPHLRELFDERIHPKAGDLVIEVSTMWKRDPDGIGRLLEIRDDPCATREEWIERGGTETEKIPTVRRYVIALVFQDGRRFTWENAMFVKVPTKL